MADIHNKGAREQVVRAITAMEDDAKYFSYAAIAWDGLSSGQREQLNQLLHQGPVWDGNVISKGDRSDLIDFGLATRCCYKGEQGYTAATYFAYSVFKAGKATPMQRREPAAS